jgi:hypothetical protein
MAGLSVEDVPMEPVHVWGVRLGSSEQEAEGILSLESDDIVFAVEDGDLRLPLDSVLKARRIRGSPVLTLDCDQGGEVVHFAFFFVKPPSLRPKGRESRGRAKRRSAGYLVTNAAKSKELIAEWEQAIRDAAAARRG